MKMYKIRISKKDLYGFNYTKKEILEKEDTTIRDLTEQEIQVIVEMLDKMLSIKSSSESACNEAS